jgi:hypothetical protein
LLDSGRHVVFLLGFLAGEFVPAKSPVFSVIP